MEKNELFEQVEGMLCEFCNKNLVRSEEEKIDTLNEMMSYIELGAKVFTTDELISELMKREGTLVLEKVIQNLDDGAVG